MLTELERQPERNEGLIRLVLASLPSRASSYGNIGLPRGSNIKQSAMAVHTEILGRLIKLSDGLPVQCEVNCYIAANNFQGSY